MIHITMKCESKYYNHKKLISSLSLQSTYDSNLRKSYLVTNVFNLRYTSYDLIIIILIHILNITKDLKKPISL